MSMAKVVRKGLAGGFKSSQFDFSLGQSEADAVIPQGGRVVVVRIKNGDPDLPLPSSTVAQMVLLQQQARDKFSASETQEVLPVLVTNYRVSADDEKQLGDLGIKVVRTSATFSASQDPGKLSQQIASLTGLHTDLV